MAREVAARRTHMHKTALGLLGGERQPSAPKERSNTLLPARCWKTAFGERLKTVA